MRIGFFTDTYTPQINGVVTSIRLFKRALEERGHEVYIFAPDPDHHEDSDVTIRFPSLPFLFQKEMRAAFPLSIDALRVLDRVDFDIIHSHDPFAIGLFGLNVARRHKVPYVHTYHTLYPEYVHYVWETRLTKRLAEVLSREFCDACDTIVAPSTKVERYLRSWGVKRPIDVIATGIDVARYSTPDAARVEALRARLALPGDERILLFMGRLGREKNIELLLRALWHSRTDSVRLLIAGDGPHRAELEELAEELDVTSRVTFAGYLERDDAIAAYHLSDAFAFGSTTETQGLVIGEALAAGLPVIAVDDPATSDFVVDGECGFLTPGRPESFASAIDRLFGDLTMLADFSEAASLRAQDFSIEHQAERLEAHYENAIANYAPRRRIPSLASLRGIRSFRFRRP